MADLGVLINTATGLSLVVRVYPGHERDVSQVVALPVPRGQRGGTAQGNAQDDAQVLLLPGEAAAQAAATPAPAVQPTQSVSQTAPSSAVTALDAGSQTDNQSSAHDSQDPASAWRDSVNASSVTVMGSTPAGADASISATSIAAIRMAPDEAHQAYRQSDVRLTTAMRAIELTG